MSTTATPIPLTVLPTPPALPALGEADAATYASWFACLAEPMRVRMLHAVATAPAGLLTVGALAEELGISQSTASHHVKKLAEVGFLILAKEGTSTLVRVNSACCTGLPHAADIVMGSLSQPRTTAGGEELPCCPSGLPDDVTVRAMAESDLDVVRRIYAEGIATGQATFETSVPPASTLWRKWLPAHRWVAEVDGEVVGWAAAVRTSQRDCYAGVAETSVYVAEGFRGRGVGKALLHRQVTAADADGLWTLHTSVFPENRASLALHHSAGYRTLAVRDRIAQLDGAWRDTVLLERRRAD
ncbi:helix-turn-helix domain-containing GNAT family N-acetyltransferase [Nocardioides taihuensis]|uniref:Helix-turn-helix domain-containing GNAT family N-acetyltransferase n=1 Tax=Nocardioides taihuensis TaxID=1835606 RepID=A0ABW0BDF8_9ACTN